MARKQSETARDPVDTGAAVPSSVVSAERRVRSTLREIDRMTQDRTADIAALARAVLRCLDTPEDRAAIQDARQLVDLMHMSADDLGNFVNCEAEEQGCNYVKAAA